MERKSKIKNEITSLRCNLYNLLDGQPNNTSTIIKASEELDKAILKYMKKRRKS